MSQSSAISFKVEVKGLEEVQKLLKQFPRKAEAEFGKAALTGARALAEGARMNRDTPVDTGRMRASINHRKISCVAAATFVGANYGIFVHEGTRKMKARPFLKWTLDRGIQRKINEIFAAAMKRVTL